MTETPVTDTLSSAPSRDLPPQPRPPALQPVELARWAWRQLTSMRSALVLLFLLALAAVPGSLVPQRSIDAARAAQFAADHPTLAPWYDRFSLFTVYSSPWFAATYLLLFVSLVGCVLPRSRLHLRAVLARPPRAPQRLGRLPFHESTTVDGAPDAVLERARAALRRRGYRVDVADGAVAAEKGYLRETGNLVFHVALLLLLLAVAFGHLTGYKANILVVEGEAFSNTVSAYDTWTPGPLADEGALAPFTVALKSLEVRYQETGTQAGAPRDFQARVRYTTSPDTAESSYDLRVNHPLKVDGVKVFLLGNGYAPVFTVRDKDGAVVSRGPVPFLPRDGNATSLGVVKVTGTSPQIGFDGFFLPTAVIDQNGPHSIYPGLKLPRALLSVWTGDLGVDGGTPQSVYSLQKSGLTQLRGENGRKLVVGLAPGTSATLPTGETITLDGVRRWASLQVARDPGTGPALVAALLALAGLMASLFVRRRRVWVRVGADGEDDVDAADGGRTLVEVAGLARSDGEGGDGLADELRELVAEIGSDDGTGARDL
ncbi:MAG: cytochrome c biogenesis protein ResB [Sporichthyaceae bacterium]